MSLLELLQEGTKEKRCALCNNYRAKMLPNYMGICERDEKAIDVNVMDTCEKWNLNPYIQEIIEELKANGLSNAERDARQSS